MKIHTISSLLMCLWACSCVNYDDASRETDIRVQLQMPAEFTEGADLEGHAVTLTLGKQKLSATTDAQGIASFTSIIPDIYNISTSWEISNTAYTALTGQAQLTGAIVSGALASQLVSQAESNSPILLPTYVSKKCDIVISKIASSGSKDRNNRNYMAGKYLELYNQLDVPVDVSGLYIGLLEGSNPQPFTLENLHEAFNDSVVILKQVFRIPAGQPCTVEPGGTVLIANSATDHSDVSDMEHDLQGADFEAKDATGRFVNNPATPALLPTWATSNMNLVQGGPCSVVIFRTDDDPASWTKTYAYGKESGPMYLPLPKRLILDGVEFLKNKSNTGPDIKTKRLYTDIDAGYTNINAISGWSGEVVYRRTAEVKPDGRKILTDTNNSTNDFKVSTTIKPRMYDDED